MQRLYDVTPEQQLRTLPRVGRRGEAGRGCGGRAGVEGAGPQAQPHTEWRSLYTVGQPWVTRFCRTSPNSWMKRFSVLRTSEGWVIN